MCSVSVKWGQISVVSFRAILTVHFLFTLRYTKGGGEAHSRDSSKGDDTVSGPRAEKDGRQKAGVEHPFFVINSKNVISVYK